MSSALQLVIDTSMELAPLPCKKSHIFAATVVFVTVGGLLLQWVVLPLTPWYFGDGLMTGGDWIGFHQLAVALAGEVTEKGWTAWVPRVDGQAPASVAAAIYAVTGVHHPSVLLPFHGLLYGAATVTLLSMAIRLGGNRRIAYLAILPLFVFPSAVPIWGQIHKDIYSLLGVLLLLGFWVELWFCADNFVKITWGRAVRELLLVGVAMSLIIFVRPYLGQVVVLASAVVGLLLSALMLIRMLGKASALRKKSIASYWVLMVVAIVAQALFVLEIPPAVTQLGTQATHGDKTGPNTQTPSAPPSTPQSIQMEHCKPWSGSDVLPAQLEKQFATLACTRDGFRTGYPDAGSNIDIEVEFSSVWDVLTYLPRALQIGALAPFPNQWLAGGQSPGGGVMRALIVPEMLVLYFALIGVFFAILRPELRIYAFILLVFSLVVILLHAISVTNIGTLYRMRYPVMSSWCVLGLIGWEAWLTSRSRSGSHDRHH